ncbi:MAG: hypothetical protein U0R17_02455 [Acidimicrobiia bacterium]
MSNWKRRTAIFGAGLIAVASGSACSSNPSSNSGNPARDTQTAGQESDQTNPTWPRTVQQGPVQTVAIGVACGPKGKLLIQAAHLNKDGFVVIPGATAAISSIVDQSTDPLRPGPAEQMFFRGQDATGTFESSLPVGDSLNPKFNDPSRKSIYLGDEKGIGESHSGLVLDYRANVPSGSSASDSPSFTFLVDYYGGSMAGQIPDADETTLDRDAGTYAGSENSSPSVSTFVDPFDSHFKGNLMDMDEPGEPYLAPVKRSPSSDYQVFTDLPNIPGEVVASITEPLTENGFVCGSAAIVPPPDLVLA